MHSDFDLIAADGTRLTAWRNSTVAGPRVLVCNGMGVPAQAWPRLLSEGCRYQVAGWNQRGVFGSDRPADPQRIEVGDHVSDAVALLDALGWEDAILVAWSMGVNIAFELANEHPKRVAGLLSVSGVPGGTFDTIMAPQRVPRPVRRPLGLGLVHMGRVMSPQLNLLTKVVPKGRPFAELIRHSGIMLPIADIKDVQPWVEAFFWQDWSGYFNLAIALERHGRIDPSFIQVPVTIVAGTFDALTAHSDVIACAREIRDVEVHSLPGSHCLPLEYPDRIMSLLDGLENRIQVHRARQALLAKWADPNVWQRGAVTSTTGSGSAAVDGAGDQDPPEERQEGADTEAIDPSDTLDSGLSAVLDERLRARDSDRGRVGLPWWASSVPRHSEPVVRVS